MNNIKSEELADARIRHVLDHRSSHKDEMDSIIGLPRKKEGNIPACIGFLDTAAFADALYEWYIEKI